MPESRAPLRTSPNRLPFSATTAMGCVDWAAMGMSSSINVSAVVVNASSTSAPSSDGLRSAARAFALSSVRIPRSVEVARYQEQRVPVVGVHSSQRRARALPLVHDRVGFPHDRLRLDDLPPRNVPHELGHVLVRRQRYDLLGRTLLDDLPVPHDGDAVAQLERLVQVVRDEHDGLVKIGLERDELVLHLPAYERVEAAERLVHQQHVGVHRQRPGESYPLLHPPAHFVRIVVLPPFQPHGLDGLRRLFVPGRLVHAADLEAVCHVVENLSVRQQRIVLKDHGDLAPAELHELLGRVAENVLAVEAHLPLGGLDQPDQAADQRRLPTAGEAHHHEDLSLVDGEGHVAQPNDQTQLFLNLGAGLRLMLRFKGALRSIPEDLPYAVDLYLVFRLIHLMRAFLRLPYHIIAPTAATPRYSTARCPNR